MPYVPTITAELTPDGIVIGRDGTRLGLVFQSAGGWVSVASGRSHAGRSWRRSRPYPTAAEAAAARWGRWAAEAVKHRARGTSTEAA